MNECNHFKWVDGACQECGISQFKMLSNRISALESATQAISTTRSTEMSDADYEHDERRAKETHEQRLSRHRFLDGVPAKMYHYGAETLKKGRWNASQGEFIYKMGDTFCVYHGESLRQHILVLGWRECIGYITLDTSRDYYGTIVE